MRKAIRCWVFVVITSVLLGGPLAIAESEVKGESDKPPGWEKGEKKGWKGDVPSGIEKQGGGIPPGWSRGKKEGWKGADMPFGLQEKEKGKGKKK